MQTIKKVQGISDITILTFLTSMQYLCFCRRWDTGYSSACVNIIDTAKISIESFSNVQYPYWAICWCWQPYLQGVVVRSLWAYYLVPSQWEHYFFIIVSTASCRMWFFFFWGGGVRVSPFIDLLNVCSYCCIQIKKFIYFLLTMRTLSWHLLRCSSLKYMGGKKTLIFILPPWNSNDPVWLLWCSTVSILLDLLGQIDGFIFLYITVCCRGNNNARLCGAAAWNAYDNGKTHDTINTFTTSPRTVTYTYIVTVIF